MSKTVTHPTLVLEWSPREVTAFDGLTGSTRTAASFSELTGFSGREAILAVSRRALFIRAVRMPNALPEEIRTVIQIRLGDLFPPSDTALAFDFLLTNDISPEGRLTIVMAMPSGELRKLLEDTRNAGVKVIAVIPAAIGSSLLAQSLGHQNAAVVQPVEGGIAVDIVAEGLIRASRVVPVSAQVNAEIARTYTMVGLPLGTVIAAGGMILEDADALTQTTTQAALLSSGIERAHVNIELPERVASRAKSSKDRKLRMSLLIGGVAALLMLYTYLEHSDATKAVTVAQNRNTAALNKLKTAVTAAESAQSDAQATEDTLDRAFSPAQTMADVTTLVCNRVTNGLWLTGLNAERGKAIQIRGTALTAESLYEYLGKLQKEERLRNVHLVSASTAEIERKPIVNFVLSAFPVGNLPLLDQAKRNS